MYVSTLHVAADVALDKFAHSVYRILGVTVDKWIIGGICVSPKPKPKQKPKPKHKPKTRTNPLSYPLIH